MFIKNYILNIYNKIPQSMERERIDDEWRMSNDGQWVYMANVSRLTAFQSLAADHISDVPNLVLPGQFREWQQVQQWLSSRESEDERRDRFFRRRHWNRCEDRRCTSPHGWYRPVPSTNIDPSPCHLRGLPTAPCCPQCGRRILHTWIRTLPESVTIYKLD